MLKYGVKVWGYYHSKCGTSIMLYRHFLSCCRLSSRKVPSVRILYADISEYSVCSIYI